MVNNVHFTFLGPSISLSSFLLWTPIVNGHISASKHWPHDINWYIYVCTCRNTYYCYFNFIYYVLHMHPCKHVITYVFCACRIFLMVFPPFCHSILYLRMMFNSWFWGLSLASHHHTFLIMVLNPFCLKHGQCKILQCNTFFTKYLFTLVWCKMI